MPYRFRPYKPCAGFHASAEIVKEITTPEKREVVAQALANLLKQPFPVYKKNLTEAEMDGQCLNSNWDGSKCDMTTYQRAGTVYLDGIDFDFEKGDRLSEKENEDLLQLATRVRQLIGKDKLLSLTTYHVGADPLNCADSNIVENCSYIENKRSTHHGEVVTLLKQSKDIFNFFNVMAYDAGPDFLWKTAMNNYSNAVGDKSKIVLGTTINSQWGPDNNFVESEENNIERARWQKENGFGGFFTWAVGANTESLSVSQQVDYINAMKSAADEAEAASGMIDGVEVRSGSVIVRMPEETYNAKNNIVLYVNGNYIAQSYDGRRYYSFAPSGANGKTGFSATPDIKKGDVVEVLLMEGYPGANGREIRSLAKITVTEAMLATPDIKLNSVNIGAKDITVLMPEGTFKEKNNIVLYINGSYVAQSYEGRIYYSYTPSKVAGQAGFKVNRTLKKGDLVEVRLMGGVPGGNKGILKSLFTEVVQ